MAIERERRFLVEGNEWKKHAKIGKKLQQGYIFREKGKWTARVRIIDKVESFITLKYPYKGLANYEFEYPIPIKDADSIYKLSPYKLIKKRYELNLNHQDWVIDFFEGDNKPLLIAEVEFSKEDELIKIPNWCHFEITGLHSLSNAALAAKPFSTWSKKDIAELKKGGKGPSIL